MVQPSSPENTTRRPIIRPYGLPTVVIRPFNGYGPREHDRGDLAEVIPRFVIRVLNGLSPVIFGSGENGRDFTYVTETARGIWPRRTQ